MEPPVGVHDVLVERSISTPDRVAFIVGDRRGEEVRRLTYAELCHDAQALAASFASVPEHSRGLLVAEDPIEFIVGLFAGFYAGLTAVPIRSPRTPADERLLGIRIEATRPQVALLGTRENSTRELLLAQFQGVNICEITPTLTAGASISAPRSRVPDIEPAVIQYTSGSTGEAKGVIVTHENYLANCETIAESLSLTKDDVAVSWLPLYHDMGLVGGVMLPISAGVPAVLLPPAGFQLNPIRWLELISEYDGTLSAAPPYAYDACSVRSSGLRHDVDLSCWRIAAIGADRVRVETLRQFAETFKAWGFNEDAFYSCYGLAEATLFVSGGSPVRSLTFEENSLRAGGVAIPAVEGKVKEIVSCGQAGSGVRIEIVDPVTENLCGELEIGEIWVSATSVAKGYLDSVGQTAEVFSALIQGDVRGGGRFLRTGDLGFIGGKELFVTSRLKDVIIHRGLNYLPEHIESTVRYCHRCVDGLAGVALGVDVDGVEEVVVVQSVRRSWREYDAWEVIATIREATAREHDLDLYGVVLAPAGAIPRTANGKVRRGECGERYEGGDLAMVAQWKRSSRVDKNGYEWTGNVKSRTTVAALPSYITVSRNPSGPSYLLIDGRCSDAVELNESAMRILRVVQARQSWGECAQSYAELTGLTVERAQAEVLEFLSAMDLRGWVYLLQDPLD